MKADFANSLRCCRRKKRVFSGTPDLSLRPRRIGFGNRGKPSLEAEMIRSFTIACAIALVTTVAQADEAIVGNWKTANGDTATIGPCRGGYCITLKTGRYAGRQIGTLQG